MVCGIGVRLPAVADGVDEWAGETGDAGGEGRVGRVEVGAVIGVGIMRRHDRWIRLAMVFSLGETGVHGELKDDKLGMRHSWSPTVLTGDLIFPQGPALGSSLIYSPLLHGVLCPTTK